MAQWHDTTYRGEVIKRGQLTTSQEKISVRTGVSKRTVQRVLEDLQKVQVINVDANRVRSKISILCYDKYQLGNGDNGAPVSPPVTSPVTPTVSPIVSTLQESNKLKNKKYIIALSDGEFDLKSFPDLWKKHFPNRPLKKFDDARAKKVERAIKKHGLNSKKKLNNYLAFCASLDWMNGRTPKRWFAGFDFLMKPDTLTKAQEGSYGQINDELEPISNTVEIKSVFEGMDIEKLDGAL